MKSILFKKIGSNRRKNLPFWKDYDARIAEFGGSITGILIIIHLELWQYYR